MDKQGLHQLIHAVISFQRDAIAQQPNFHEIEFRQLTFCALQYVYLKRSLTAQENLVLFFEHALHRSSLIQTDLSLSYSTNETPLLRVFHLRYFACSS